jgi:23S rRNA pseudouridine1911/1915/1917 synthase
MEAGHGQEGAQVSSTPVPSVLQVPASCAGLRADAFLSRELPHLSRTRIRQKIQMGESFLNGRRYSTSTRLRAWDQISVLWRAPPEQGPVPDLEILHEDGHVIIVNKPAGVASHPMGKRQSGTVVQFARLRYAKAIRESLLRGDMTFYPTLVNRLDVFTSGIVILATTHAVQKAMQAFVEQRLIAREYIALVEGSLRNEEGMIELPIGTDTASTVRLKMACRSDGKESVTAYSVMERFPGHTLLRVTPFTGRQHQIRVHLASIGHPVFGDLLYKDEALFLAAQRTGQFRSDGSGVASFRHFLHARRVRFVHPVTDEVLIAEAPTPPDFQDILSQLRYSNYGESG